MTNRTEQPNVFLWVLRGLTSVFMLGYLTFIYLAVFIYELFPSGNLAQDLPGIGLPLLFGLGYYLIWKRLEGLAGIILILWYAAIWLIEIMIVGNNFEDIPAPGILALFLGILLIIYRLGARKRQRETISSDESDPGGE